MKGEAARALITMVDTLVGASRQIDTTNFLI